MNLARMASTGGNCKSPATSGLTATVDPEVRAVEKLRRLEGKSPLLRRASWACLVVAVLVATAGSSAQSPADFELFDAARLHDVRLFINSRDYRTLIAHYADNTYYPADFLWNGVRIRNVAVRSRGTGSRNPYKIGLKVDFNRYVSGRQVAGLTALVLDNFWQDPAMIREALAMALFNNLRYPAPRESFCRFYINNEYQGLYAMVEPIDAQFLARAVGDPTAYLFEFKWITNFYGQSLGDSPAAYRPLFLAQTHDLESDTELYAPIRDLFNEANHEMDAVWRSRVERYVDLENLVTQLAIETFLSEPDGLAGYAGMNNFYLYRQAGSTKHRFLPWDKDVAFERADSPLTLRLDENVLISRALMFDDLRALYYDVLERAATAAATKSFLSVRVERFWHTIADAAHEDPRKPTSNETLDTGIAYLREFARTRSSFVLGEVAKARGAGR
jgi:spore coat protein H